MRQYQISFSSLKSILSDRIYNRERRKQRKRILRKVLNTDVLVIPFDQIRHYTYKNYKKILLHYPAKNFMLQLMVKEILKENLPMLGLIILRTDKNKNIIAPFAEVSIENIFLPEQIEGYWSRILNKKNLSPQKSLYDIYCESFKKKINNVDVPLRKAFDHFFQQRNFNDSLILNNLIKYNKGGSFDKNNSALLWVSCEILENMSASHLNINGERIRIYDFLLDNKLGRHSVAYGLSMETYIKFKKGLKNSSDYTVGDLARKKSFLYFDGYFNDISKDYLLRYKQFSEEAWRDLLCKRQFEFIDNNGCYYDHLFHLIWEIKNEIAYELVDLDTEVKFKKEVNKNTEGNLRLDAFLYFKSKNNLKSIKLYIEFKNFRNPIIKQKDYYFQPKATMENKFESERYKHNNGDTWYYILISNGYPFDKRRKSIKTSGLLKEDYINFTWQELFSILENDIFIKAHKSRDKKLLNYIQFLEKV